MKLKNIIKPGIIGIGIGVFATGESSAEGLQPWQIDNSNKNQITVHVKKGDTLGEIARDLDKRIGRYDDPNDLRENLEWFTKNGYIIETDCGNPLKNPNSIKPERYSIIGPALRAIDPDYGKQDTSSIENKTKINEKDIQVKTESKTHKRGERSLIGDISRVREYNKNTDRIGKAILNVGIDYGIFEGLDKRFGEGMVFDVSAGYSLPGLDLTIGWSGTEVNTNEYVKWRDSFFGFSDELDIDLESKFLNQIYAQLMIGSKNFKIGGRVGVMSIGDRDIEAEYKSGWGWSEGEYSRVKEYLEDKPKGYSIIGKMVLPFDDYASISINGKFGKYDIKNGPDFNIYSIGAGVDVKF